MPSLTEVLTRQASETAEPADHEVVAAALSEMIEHEQYPCLGARSALRRDGVTVAVADELGAPASIETVAQAVRSFGDSADPHGGFVSLIVVFRGPEIADERHYERLLWQTLQGLQDVDDAPWAEGVSTDPADDHFAFSFAGTAYFVVGLHPQASRIARRAPRPSLVFNLHEQFEELRRGESFERMRDTIRRRDEALQGSVNPMVTDHGAAPEARQYAGRVVGRDWHAPFTAKENR